MSKLATMGVPADIRFEGVTKSFRKGFPILRGVDLVIPAGKLTYILGSSGAGKSVMLKHILGLIKPDSGKIFVAGQDFTAMRSRDLIQSRKIFGVLFQNSALFDDLNVFDNVAFPLREHTQLSEEEIETQVFRSLEMLGFSTQAAGQLPNELSGGMRKRVGLARAIIREPAILLYDEPTTGLDPLTRITVDELIETLKNKLQLTSVVISHDIPSALQLADQIAFLHEGQIVFCGTSEEFVRSKHEAIEKFIDVERRTMRALTRLNVGDT